jgi:UDP-N-acetylmuramoylalanine--D-glutamate ligase
MSAAQKKMTTHCSAVATKPADMVFGIGNTGLSIARYLKRNDIAAIYVDSRDEPPGLQALQEIAPDAQVILGKLRKNILKGVERLIVSPGISESDALLHAAREARIEIVSDIELFVQEVDTDFVAITGSNGKSTVTTLLALMCMSAGKRALAGANLGEPALDLLAAEETDLFVLELSSFQLQRTRHLPAQVAVLLNISPDHLDWHENEDEYREAKYRIFTDALSVVFNRDDAEAAARIGAGVRQISFGSGVPEDGHYGIVSENGIDFLARGSKLLLACTEIALLGAHNRANALAALAAGELIGIDLPAMLQVLCDFPGLPHRMQFVTRVNGIDYINDSKATNIDAAIASVNSVPGPIVLIAGGQGKGGDFDHLARSVHEKLRAAIVIGEDANLIANAFDKLALVHFADQLSDAIVKASGIAQAGDTVLLAPACASFDQFDNFMARGDQFCNIVLELAA